MLRENGASKTGKGLRMLSVKVSMRCREFCTHSICCARRAILPSCISLFMNHVTLLYYTLCMQLKRLSTMST